MAFTCPLCAAVSHSPEDERQGYCGRCRAFVAVVNYACPACGDVYVPQAGHAGPFGCPRHDPPQVMTPLYDIRPAPASGAAQRDYGCRACGRRTTVPPDHVGRVWCPCGSPEAMVPGYTAAVNHDSLALGVWQHLPPSAFEVPVEFLEPPGTPDREQQLTSYVAATRLLEQRYGIRSAPLVTEPVAFEWSGTEQLQRDLEEIRASGRNPFDLASLTAEVRGEVTAEVVRLFCGEESSQNSAEDPSLILNQSADSAGPETDIYPWDSAMRWSPGCAEW